MSETLVITTTIVALAWINWYFFLGKRVAAVVVTGAGGGREITVAVQGGYDPSTIKVRRGEPVRIVFDRQETSGCSEEVVFPDFGIKRFLPAFEKTQIVLTPEKAGSFDFTCGMSMLRGKLIVEE